MESSLCRAYTAPAVCQSPREGGLSPIVQTVQDGGGYGTAGEQLGCSCRCAPPHSTAGTTSVLPRTSRTQFWGSPSSPTPSSEPQFESKAADVMNVLAGPSLSEGSTVGTRGCRPAQPPPLTLYVTLCKSLKGGILGKTSRPELQHPAFSTNVSCNYHH